MLRHLLLLAAVCSVLLRHPLQLAVVCSVLQLLRHLLRPLEVLAPRVQPRPLLLVAFSVLLPQPLLREVCSVLRHPQLPHLLRGVSLAPLPQRLQLQPLDLVPRHPRLLLRHRAVCSELRLPLPLLLGGYSVLRHLLLLAAVYSVLLRHPLQLAVVCSVLRPLEVLAPRVQPRPLLLAAFSVLLPQPLLREVCSVLQRLLLEEVSSGLRLPLLQAAYSALHPQLCLLLRRLPLRWLLLLPPRRF